MKPDGKCIHIPAKDVCRFGGQPTCGDFHTTCFMPKESFLAPAEDTPFAFSRGAGSHRHPRALTNAGSVGPGDSGVRLVGTKRFIKVHLDTAQYHADVMQNVDCYSGLCGSWLWARQADSAVARAGFQGCNEFVQRFGPETKGN